MGDLHGINTLEHQPQKVAAMEANWETQEGAPLVLFAIPDEEERTNKYAIEIPNLASFILRHDWGGEVPGLNDYIGDHPPVAPLFWGFRIMVGTGILMLITSWWAFITITRKKDLSKPVAWTLIGMTFSGWVATVSGWYVTEIGRQPYLVYGVLRTEDAVADIPVPMVGTTLAIYLSVYVLIMGAFITTLYYMANKAGEGGGQDPEKDRVTGIERRSAASKAADEITDEMTE